MAVNDITPLDEAQFGSIGGARYYPVQANESGKGTGSTYTPAFRPGEPVLATLGGTFASTIGVIGTGTSSKPVVATDFFYGIAMGGQGGFSTETDTAAGFVYVQPIVPNVVYLGNLDSSVSSFNDTQAHYNTKIGFRVLIKMDTSTPPKYTILGSDSSTSGLQIEYIDITKYPGKVAFSFRNSLSYAD